MFPATNPPVIDSINAHYDHHRALPGRPERGRRPRSILFTTGDLRPRHARPTRDHDRLPLGHARLRLPRSRPDLPPTGIRATPRNGAIGYIAQSTFGLGETAGVAYSEKLHALLAERLDGSLTVGQALVFAKQEYSAMPLHGRLRRQGDRRVRALRPADVSRRNRRGARRRRRRCRW